MASTNKFKRLAQEELSHSKLQAGREQITTDELVNYAELTIVAVDMATGFDSEKQEETTYPVVIFKELPDKYYNGGVLLKKMVVAWAAEFDGDFELTSAELEKDGGCPVRFENGKTKTGRNITNIFIP